VSRSTSKAPDRIAWAVELLDVHPDDQILEVGCGPGVAVGLVCARLGAGQITAIDRSSTSIERTRARNADHVEAGRAVLVENDLAGFDGDRDRFDKAFAVNVNLFWTRDPTTELDVLRRVLRPGGVLRLVYGEEPSGHPRDQAAVIVPRLEERGFRSEVSHDPTGTMLCLSGWLRC
jgi:SAM-dependent methyltransferase